MPTEAEYRAYWDQRRDTDIHPPLHDQLGLELVHLTPTTVLTMQLSDSVRGPVPGSIHGGILATFADVASAVSLWESFNREVEMPVTTDMHVRY